MRCHLVMLYSKFHPLGTWLKRLFLLFFSGYSLFLFLVLSFPSPVRFPRIAIQKHFKNEWSGLWFSYVFDDQSRARDMGHL